MNTVWRWALREDCDMHECLCCTSESLVWEHRVDPWSWASFSLRLFLVSWVSCMLGWPGPSDEQSWNKASIRNKGEIMSTLEWRKETKPAHQWKFKDISFGATSVCSDIITGKWMLNRKVSNARVWHVRETTNQPITFLFTNFWYR